MDVNGRSEAAEFLAAYAERLQRAVHDKWTGEMATGIDVEQRLLALAARLRGMDPLPDVNWEAEADFLQSQATMLRSPSQLILDDPLSTAEWRSESAHTLEVAETLEQIAGMIRQLGR
jgi:hypothetical protein